MSGAAQSLALSESERGRAERVDHLTATGVEGIPELLGMLRDPSWTVRRAVVAALATLGEPAVGALCVHLQNQRGDEAGVAATVDALVASTGPADAAVAALAAHPDPAIAADVAQILGRRHSTEQLPTLIALAAHADDNVAVAALEALGRIGGRAAIASLIQAVHSGSFFRTFPAIDVLGRSGDPRAVECLTGLLHNRTYLLEAARALGRSGDRGAAAALARLLGSPVDGDVRVAAVALAELRRRYGERFGAALSIDEAMQRSAPEPTSTRRLGQVLSTAEPAEQRAICLVLGALRRPAALPILLEFLTADSAAPELIRAAVEALQQLGPTAEAELPRALRSGDSRQRAALLPLVNRGGATDDVLRCLEDADPEVRAGACETLGRLGNPQVAEVLVRALDDRSPRVTQAAAAALQSLGGPETLRLVMEAASSPAAAVRRSAVRILGYLGHPLALPVVLLAIRDADPRVRDSALYGLPFFDEPAALQALLEAAAAPSERTRAAAVRALGQTRAEPEVGAALLVALDDPDAWVRYYACQSLGTLGLQAAAGAIARRLEDPAGQVRLGAIEALSHFPIDAAQRALERAARSDDADMRRAALVGLGISGRPEALPVLIEATGSPDAATRLVAFSAVTSLEGESGASRADLVRALVAGASDADPAVRGAALRCLASRHDASAALLELFRRAPEDQAVQAALSLPSPQRIVEVTAALRDADDELAPHLAEALARMHDPAARAALIDALEAGSGAAKRAAAPALAALATEDALRALRAAMIEDPDPEVRRICSLLLAS